MIDGVTQSTSRRSRDDSLRRFLAGPSSPVSLREVWNQPGTSRPRRNSLPAPRPNDYLADRSTRRLAAMSLTEGLPRSRPWRWRHQGSHVGREIDPRSPPEVLPARRGPHERQRIRGLQGNSSDSMVRATTRGHVTARSARDSNSCQARVSQCRQVLDSDAEQALFETPVDVVSSCAGELWGVRDHAVTTTALVDKRSAGW